ncbi:hypothetical protein UA08_01608 [Talaromyces atroroseus]|uniref:DASH complex subunit DUO1 n=1 Tax=Talaromyces atroroseus TaxID=1441469 RepID=A0A1Q5QB33_TALAT|nr:hypothetical protein UA08_01608 [Talaromyces atroroseus]OKL63153.1 hypothetical protein UA08_01608 [Talaromyces atroroseus]
MAAPSATDEMDRLQLSDKDWASPSQRRTTPAAASSAERTQNRETTPSLDQQEAREIALRNELQTVRNVNLAIEGVLASLERAKGNMETVSRTVDSASTLLNTWTRILSQTEHNQRLLLDPRWQGASHDIAEMESEAAAKQQAAERRERELQERREAAARKAEKEEKARAAGTAAAGRGRGTVRGRAVRGGLGRTPSVSASKTSTATKTARPGSAAATRRPVSGIARGSSVTRGRGKP